MLRFHEVQVLWGHGHGFPVESAFEEERPACITGTLETRFEFGFEAVVLFGVEVAVCSVHAKAFRPVELAKLKLNARPLAACITKSGFISQECYCGLRVELCSEDAKQFDILILADPCCVMQYEYRVHDYTRSLLIF
jgi:hypothetical protein